MAGMTRDEAALEDETGQHNPSGEPPSVPLEEEPDDLESDAYWIGLARDSHAEAINFFDQTIRRRLEDNINIFHSKHPAGSPYNTPAYRKRSRLFRSKPRAGVRKLESAVAVALFASHDAVATSAEDQSDEFQALAAEAQRIIINEHLDHNVSWFVTCLGAAQDAMVNGIVISRQDWRYETGTDYDMVDGQLIPKTVIREDRPDIELRPPENFLFSPAADWRDVVNSSPYLIDKTPMYVGDIKARQEVINPHTGEPWYRPIPEGALEAAQHMDWDSVRKARDGQGPDRYDEVNRVSEFTSVWVHRNIFRINGVDWYLETLGEDRILMDPIPLSVISPTRGRNYVVGTSVVEAHRIYPTSIIGLGKNYSQEINDLSNLRIDNVRLALNKRYKIRRGADVDIAALMVNVPGGGVLMQNPDDVQEMEYRDVTGSSYQEHDRLAIEMDEITGNFSQSTVANRRQLSDTLGGLSMVSQDANQVQELTIRTLLETWAEPVLRQVRELVSGFESDNARLTRVANRLSTPEVPLGVGDVIEMLMVPTHVRIAVGFNATNPQVRLQRVIQAFGAAFQIQPQLQQTANPAEIVKEIFGAAGFQDGTRFFPALEGDVDPQVGMLQQQVQQLTAALEGKQMEQEVKLQIADKQQQTALAQARIRAEVELMKVEAAGNTNRLIEEMRVRLEEYDRMLATAKEKREQQQLWLQRDALAQSIRQQEREWVLKRQEATRRHAVEDMGPRTGAKDLAGDDPAGTISRERYGMIPGEGG